MPIVAAIPSHLRRRKTDVGITVIPTAQATLTAVIQKFNPEPAELAQVFRDYLRLRGTTANDLPGLQTELLARASEAEAAILERTGRVLNSEELSQRCGVTRQSVNRWKDAHEVLAVSLSGKRGDLFPSFQLSVTNKVLPWVIELLRRIPDGWEALSFLTSRRESLKGQSHLGLILGGKAGAVEDMLAAADAYIS